VFDSWERLNRGKSHWILPLKQMPAWFPLTCEISVHVMWFLYRGAGAVWVLVCEYESMYDVSSVFTWPTAVLLMGFYQHSHTFSIMVIFSHLFLQS